MHFVFYDEETTNRGGHPEIGPYEIAFYKHQQSVGTEPGFDREFDLGIGPI